MQTKTKWIIGVLLIAVIGASVYFSNSSSQKGAFVSKLPIDLVAENISVTSAMPGDTEINVGDGVSLSATIRNSSATRIPGFTSGFFIGAERTPSLTTSTGPMAANGTETESMGWIANREGRIQISACADTGSIIRETNEKNNCVSTTVTIFPPPPPIYTGEIGTLSIENADAESNIRSSQIVAGTTNVNFGAFRFSAGPNEPIRMRRIVLRNIGTNSDGLANIKMNRNGAIWGDAIALSFSAGRIIVLNYIEDIPVIATNDSAIVSIIANTIYSATSGSTVQFVIESIEAEGVNSGAPIAVSLSSLSPSPLKVLYPTKLNFAWVAPASTTLTPGTGIEVGRFTLGADAAFPGNSAASASVSALNFTSLSTARLTRIRIQDVETGSDITGTNGANSTSFSTSEAGGALTAQVLEDGQTKTYKILADVSANITTSVSAQFRFNAGTYFTPGTATWSVTNNGVTSNSNWTVLSGDATDVSSTPLISVFIP